MLLTSSFTLTLRFTLAKISHCCLCLPIFASQCHPVVILFPCSAIKLQLYTEGYVQILPFQSRRCHSRRSEHTDESWSWFFPPSGLLWQNTACLSLPCAWKTTVSSDKSHMIKNCDAPVRKSRRTSPSPASLACGRQSRTGCRWQCSLGRPHWWKQEKMFIIRNFLSVDVHE